MKTFYIQGEPINCSIACNNEVIRDILHKNGYTPSNTFWKDGRYIFVAGSSKRYYDSSNSSFRSMVKGEYDSMYGLFCGTDVEMFKSLISLSDKTDKDQLFVLDTNLASLDVHNDIIPKDSFVRCNRDKWYVDVLDDGSPDPLSSRNIPAHKASIEEIINFYCKKDNEKNVHRIF